MIKLLDQFAAGKHGVFVGIHEFDSVMWARAHAELAIEATALIIHITVEHFTGFTGLFV